MTTCCTVRHWMMIRRLIKTICWSSHTHLFCRVPKQEVLKLLNEFLLYIQSVAVWHWRQQLIIEQSAEMKKRQRRKSDFNPMIYHNLTCILQPTNYNVQYWYSLWTNSVPWCWIFKWSEKELCAQLWVWRWLSCNSMHFSVRLNSFWQI